MRSLIKRNLKGKTIIPLFLLAGIIYTIMMTITIPKVMSYSGGMKILDMMPTGYNIAYVNALLTTLGEEGRNTYLYNQIPLDLIYPLLFGASLCLILAYILRKLEKLEGHLYYVCLLPLFAALFDYCENIGVIAMLNSYPNNSNILTVTTNVFSVLKSSFTTINFIMLIALLVILGIRKLFLKDQLHK
jgi:hypothetical protein